jgi:hypothetical protein
MSNDKPLTWVSHPMREYPITTAVLLLFLAAMAAFLWDVTMTPADQNIALFSWLGMDVKGWDMPLFYYLGVAFLFFSLITYFIPTYYECGEQSIKVKYWFVTMQRQWSDFGCYYQDARGVMLSTFRHPRRLDPFRGLSLRFSRSRNEKEVLLEILNTKIGNKA